MTNEKLAVVVPTYRRVDSLERCLLGLFEQTRPADEILVVARGDDAASVELVQRFAGQVTLVIAGRPGQVAALAAGARATSAGLIAFTDDDAVPRAEWLSRICWHFSDRAVAGVGGRDVVHHDDGVEEGMEPVVGILSAWGRPIGNHHLGSGGTRSVQILKGCNCAYRRDVFALPEGLRGRGAEPMNDLATSLRASTMGTLIYDPDLIVDHYPAERFDDDGRSEKSDVALLDAVYNQAFSVLSVRPVLRFRYRLFYFAVGDAVTPGLLRTLFAIIRGDVFVKNRFFVTQRTLGRAGRQARVCPLQFSTRNELPPRS